MGLFLMTASILITKNKASQGYTLAAGCLAILSMGMGYRCMVTTKTMPGVVALVGFLGFAYNLTKAKAASSSVNKPAKKGKKQN